MRKSTSGIDSLALLVHRFMARGFSSPPIYRNAYRFVLRRQFYKKHSPGFAQFPICRNYIAD
jgi:hypothetical protein